MTGQCLLWNKHNKRYCYGGFTNEIILLDSQIQRYLKESCLKIFVYHRTQSDGIVDQTKHFFVEHSLVWQAKLRSQILELYFRFESSFQFLCLSNHEVEMLQVHE